MLKIQKKYKKNTKKIIFYTGLVFLSIGFFIIIYITWTLRENSPGIFDLLDQVPGYYDDDKAVYFPFLYMSMIAMGLGISLVYINMRIKKIKKK